jgi:hypothetical protein
MVPVPGTGTCQILVRFELQTSGKEAAWTLRLRVMKTICTVVSRDCKDMCTVVSRDCKDMHTIVSRDCKDMCTVVSRDCKNMHTVVSRDCEASQGFAAFPAFFTLIWYRFLR